MENTPSSFYLYNLPDVLTVAQMQSVLHIGRKAAYDLIHSGSVKHLKIGKSIRIPKIFLLEYMETSCYNKEATDRLPEETEVIYDR